MTLRMLQSRNGGSHLRNWRASGAGVTPEVEHCRPSLGSALGEPRRGTGTILRRPQAIIWPCRSLQNE